MSRVAGVTARFIRVFRSSDGAGCLSPAHVYVQVVCVCRCSRAPHFAVFVVWLCRCCRCVCWPSKFSPVGVPASRVALALVVLLIYIYIYIYIYLH